MRLSAAFSGGFTFQYLSIKYISSNILFLLSSVFTFHYVSIKSQREKLKGFVLDDLHSTMYLLNQTFLCSLHAIQLYLHSTMYLLNLGAEAVVPLEKNTFTFHYVSIKSLLTK